MPIASIHRSVLFVAIFLALVVPHKLGQSRAAADAARELQLSTSPKQSGPRTNAAPTHWAFQPVRAPKEPEVRNSRWPRNAIDRFVLARLEKENLTPSTEADRVALIRRLSFDLIGLPPTPDEVDAFVFDNRSDAYERLVERLLASAHYGERWGRHWLDAVGYADSNGYFDADSDRPLAYKYRDYIVKSLNEDKPIDRFIQEQFAGDELAGYDPNGDVTPEMVEPLIATHLLRNGPDGTGESDGNPLEVKVDRYAVLEWNVQILGSAFLGLTLQCSRCHDHKFEPITQAEYYGLQAILRPAYDPEHWRKPNERLVTVAPRAVREENQRQHEKFEREVKALKESLEGVLAPFRELVLEENLGKVDPTNRVAIRKALDTPEKKRSEEMKALLKKHEEKLAIKDEDLVKRFSDVAAGYMALKDSLKRREADRPVQLPQIAALTESVGALPVHRILVRGNHAQEGREVGPVVPAILCQPENKYDVKPRRAGPTSSGRRLALARWLTSRENPVVARVFVNRVWQRYFTKGIVATLDNFGVTGAKPSHPGLLDYLAAKFMDSGWRLKDLHRLIVNSATYRQACFDRDAEHAVDPDNRLLWRFPLRRLDGESLRDSMLFVAGEIDLSLGGAYVPADKTDEGQFVVSEKNPGVHRRSLYLQQRRSKPVTMLDLFDGAQMNPNCVQRATSTVALQSLALLNSDFARRRSESFAVRILKEPALGQDRRIELAFRLAMGRVPKLEERNAAMEFLNSQRGYYAGKTSPEKSAWIDFCQMLMASNSFLYLE